MSELRKLLRRELDSLYDDLQPELVKLRRRLHANPELRFEERETSGTLESLLRPLEVSVRDGVAKTGLLADLHGDSAGPTVALRADMDALPIQDAKDMSYASRRPGVMHACGHDGHMAIAYGVLRVLEPLRERLPGVLRVIFQPAEEIPAGEKSGAREVMEAGGLEDPAVEAIFGMHVWPDLPAGVVGLQRGATMAAADSFLISITGESAHAAEPHKGRDAIYTASNLVVQLKSLPGRAVPPSEPLCINVGSFHGGETQSIIADHVELSGTLRTLGGESRERVVRRMEQVAEGIAVETGCEVDLRFSDSFPAVENDPDLYKRVGRALPEVLGEGRLQELDEVPMTADDFAYYLESVPGLYLKIGCGPRDGAAYPLHHPSFDLDERALWTGVEAMTASIVAAMESGGVNGGSR